MTVMAYEPRTQEEVVLEGFLALDTPEGFRAELIEGEIVVTPPPDGDHEDYISLILTQVIKMSQTEMQSSGNKGLKIASGGQRPSNHAIPDITFAPKEKRLFRGAASWMPCEGVEMTVEVTSTRPDRDRTAKHHCYARGGIPLYLLVDRHRSTITLFSDPEGEEYNTQHTVAFGKKLSLPKPFGFDLDTSDFS
jgi:Uma2 family endonuclease